MATFEIKMPKLGESITEGTILSWSVKVGDHVQEDDTLFEVSTAKVSAEIPSPVAGKILEIFFQEGDTVDVGIVVATIQPDEEERDASTPEENASSRSADSASSETPPSSPKQAEATAPTGKPVSSPSGQTSPGPGHAASEAPSGSASEAPETPPKENEKSSEENARWYSPVVMQLAKEANISQEELDRISGSGYMGRLSKKDIKEYIARKKSGQSVSATSSEQAPQPTAPKPDNSRTSNAQQADDSRSATPPTTQTGNTSDSPGPKHAPEDTVIEMDRIRRVIADHMVFSKKVSPHVTSVIEVDVTPLVRWRTQNKEAFFKQTGVKLTYMPAIAEATARALKEYPQVNASVDSYRIILKRSIHLGIAVSLSDGNLIVPVIRDADRLNLNGLAAAIDSLAQKARSNKLAAADIQGGTFTITNFGTFKSLFGTPIINQPEVAILAVGYVEKKPAVVSTPDGDAIAIRHKMYLSLSYDHRIIDGALAGSFLRRIGDMLENWKV